MTDFAPGDYVCMRPQGRCKTQSIFMYDKPNSGTINLFVLQPGTRCLVIARIGGLKGFMCVMLLSDAGEVGWTNRERELQKV